MEKDINEVVTLNESIQKELDELIIEYNNYEYERTNIGNKDVLIDAIQNIIYEQIIIQFGADAASSFIKGNNDLKLDLSNKAHYISEKDFINHSDSITATHNPNYKKYQERLNDYNNSLELNSDGTYKLAKNARSDYDINRPKGSKTVNKDHVIPVSEIIKDPEVATYFDKKDKISFANSDTNIQDLDSAANQSKRDLSTRDWFATKRDDKSPEERFNIDKDKMLAKDDKARDSLKKEKKIKKKEVIKEGVKSQANETFRISVNLLKAELMTLLARLLQDILIKFREWLKEKDRNITNLISYIKEGIEEFISKVKDYLVDSTQVVIHTIVASIIGPIGRILNKVVLILKQGFRAFKEAIEFFMDEDNASLPYDVKLIEVGKIVIGSIEVVGTAFLSEAITGPLMTIPGFAVEIPVLGSIASVTGVFISSVVTAIVGAIVINKLDEVSASRRTIEVVKRELNCSTKVLDKQDELIDSNSQELYLSYSEMLKSI